MKKQSICVTPPPDESNNIFQMKNTFKKINPRNKLRVSTHFRYDYKSTNYKYNNYQKPQHSKIPPPQGRQLLSVTFVGGGATKHLNVKIEGKEIIVII